MTLMCSIHNNNSDNKKIYKYMNLKRMLLVMYARTDFNKTCLKQNLTPIYARLNKSNNLVLKFFCFVFLYINICTQHI